MKHDGHGHTKMDTGKDGEHNIDGTGMHASKMKGVENVHSVDHQFARADVPGGGQTGESGKGTWIREFGPHPGHGYVKVPS